MYGYGCCETLTSDCTENYRSVLSPERAPYIEGPFALTWNRTTAFDFVLPIVNNDTDLDIVVRIINSGLKKTM
jgi:hypothetical protein